MSKFTVIYFAWCRQRARCPGGARLCCDHCWPAFGGMTERPLAEQLLTERAAADRAAAGTTNRLVGGYKYDDGLGHPYACGRAQKPLVM